MDDKPLYFIHTPKPLTAQDWQDKFGINLDEILSSQRDFKVNPRTAEDSDDFLLRLICHANDRAFQATAGDYLDRACARIGIVRRARDTASPKRKRMFGIDVGDVSGDSTEIIFTMQDGTTHKILALSDKFWFGEAKDISEHEFCFGFDEAEEIDLSKWNELEKVTAIFNMKEATPEQAETYRPETPNQKKSYVPCGTSKKRRGKKWKN